MKGQSVLKIAALVCIVIAVSGYAQVRQEWVARYNGSGSGDDKASAIALDANDNVYVTGGSVGANGYDFTTMKYDASGVQQWVSRYDGTGGGEDMASAIALDATGNIYITGWSEDSGTSTDFTTIKYNGSGVQQWVARYDGPGSGWDEPFDLAVHDDGSLYVVGAGIGASGSSDITVVKYDGSGNQLWVNRYSKTSAHSSEARAMAIDALGNVYIGGWTQLTTDDTGQSFDCVTLKYTSGGNEEWVADYDGPAGECDRAYGIVLDDEGSVIVSGTSEGDGTGLDYVTIKYSGTGEEQWVARYDGTGNGDDIALALESDGTGDVYVTGLSMGSGTSWDYTTIKYNTSGEEQWVGRHDGPGHADDAALAIGIDAMGDVYVTGGSCSDSNPESEDYTTIKYESDGEQEWVIRYDGPDSYWDEACALALDSEGNVCVTGLSYGDTNTCEDFATVMYKTVVCVRGDAVCDGMIDILDIIAVIGHILGTAPLTGDALFWGDCNGDESINILDALSIVNVILEIIPECPGGPIPCKPIITAEVMEYFESLELFLPNQDFIRLMALVKSVTMAPVEFELEQNSPNPFNQTTDMRYQIPDGSSPVRITLKIFNLLGQEVRTLVDEVQESGSYIVTWDGEDAMGQAVGSGVYFYRLQTSDFAAVKRMLLMK
ncbi:MAG: T9SS type A sorting domain-containing protein [Gemmatimonadota bacterium]|nr:MAG: T9SS type A sorting domain-containing protein [Gemmatimonadota bacterium]